VSWPEWSRLIINKGLKLVKLALARVLRDNRITSAIIDASRVTQIEDALLFNPI
jgi:aryl-alcohol dehydrogenase-like predicted oxidoreductase